MLFPLTSNAKKCADFKTQKEAQDWYEKRKKNPVKQDGKV